MTKKYYIIILYRILFTNMTFIKGEDCARKWIILFDKCLRFFVLSELC